MIRDFFVQINTPSQKDSSGKALKYFRELFANAVNEVIEENGFVLTYSKDQAIDAKMPIKCSHRNAHIYISGECDIPDYLIESTGNSADEQTIGMLFEKHGESVFERLSGNFIVLINYHISKVIKVVNSKLALYPLYYYRNNDSLMLSTRLGLFREIIGTNHLNYGVLMQFSLYNYPVSSATFLKDVFLLPAASIMTFQHGELSIGRYWSIMEEFGKNSDIKSLKQSTALLDDVLNKTIGNKCKLHERVGISLTGGWDGRLILAYSLKYCIPDHILLYSHGTKDNPDVVLPSASAKKLGYNYLPVLLTDAEYVRQQLKWAEDTVKYADGLRQVSRLHYLYNMSVLKNEHEIDFILSGIGGSNLLKSTNYKPCDVFNKYVIELIESDNIEVTLKKHFDLMMSGHSALFNQIGFDEFLATFDLNSFTTLHQIQNKTQRFIYFLISEIERRYFGPELQSYRHLVTNYSPFFDDAFIIALANTVFFELASNTGLVKSHYISLLYARLTSKNNRSLSKEPTDRGFSMYDVANPLLFPVMLFKYFRKKYDRSAKPDYFNHKVFIQNYLHNQSSGLNNQQMPFEANRLFIENYVTAMTFLNANYQF